MRNNLFEKLSRNPNVKFSIKMNEEDGKKIPAGVTFEVLRLVLVSLPVLFCLDNKRWLTFGETVRKETEF